jgi:hypothetical protein
VKEEQTMRGRPENPFYLDIELSVEEALTTRPEGRVLACCTGAGAMANSFRNSKAYRRLRDRHGEIFSVSRTNPGADRMFEVRWQS